jgi:hypothetical protein
MENFIVSIIASLVAAAVAGTVGYALRGKRLKQVVKAAPSIYADRLGGLIEKAYNDGVERALVNAHAIVSVRNDMRSSLISVSQHLNAEISMLQAILYGDYESQEMESTLKRFLATKGKSLTKADPAQVYRLIEVLYKTWPEKRKIIETQIRKLVTELGLENA